MKRALGSVVVIIVALTLVALSSETSHAEEPVQDREQSEWAPYPEDGAGAAATEIEISFDLLSTTSGECIYSTWGDWPHLSSNDVDVSAHGYWEDDSSGQCPRYADVEVWLEAHRCTTATGNAGGKRLPTIRSGYAHPIWEAKGSTCASLRDIQRNRVPNRC